MFPGLRSTWIFSGGLTAVIWTDTIQTGIMMVGAIALMVLSKLHSAYHHKPNIAWEYFWKFYHDWIFQYLLSNVT